VLKSERFASDVQLQEAANNHPWLDYGKVGTGVKRLQEALEEVFGYSLPRSKKKGTMDGVYKRETKKAVLAFQRDYGVEPPFDGKAGRKTLTKMDAFLPGPEEIRRPPLARLPNDDLVVAAKQDALRALPDASSQLREYRMALFEGKVPSNQWLFALDDAVRSGVVALPEKGMLRAALAAYRVLGIRPEDRNAGRRLEKALEPIESSAMLRSGTIIDRDHEGLDYAAARCKPPPPGTNLVLFEVLRQSEPQLPRSYLRARELPPGRPLRGLLLLNQPRRAPRERRLAHPPRLGTRHREGACGNRVWEPVFGSPKTDTVISPER